MASRDQTIALAGRRMRHIYLIFKREYLFVCRQRSEIILPWLFLLLMISLFPLGVTSDPAILRIISPWLMYCLPLLFFIPVLDLWLPLTPDALFILSITLLLATPTLHFIGAIFSALTVNLHHHNVLLGLLTLPFYVPILIFATTSIDLS